MVGDSLSSKGGSDGDDPAAFHRTTTGPLAWCDRAGMAWG